MTGRKETWNGVANMNHTGCPQCSGSNIKKGVIASGVNALHMYSYENRRSQSSPVFSYYCADCGFIFGSFVEDPCRIKD